LEYHQGASADVKSAVAWYQKHSLKAALDFIEELHRAADTIREAPERWLIGKNNTRRFLLWRFPFAILIFRTGIRGHNLGRRPR
jgi:toxin ParE1/3/4